MNNAWRSLSAALLLVPAAGCASKSEPSPPPPACRPVMLPAWVLHLNNEPSLIRHLDQIIEPYEPASNDSSKH